MPGEAPFTGLPFPEGPDLDGIVAAIKKLAETIVQMPLGSLVDWSGRGDPADTKWLAADGRAISRATYVKLFKEIVPELGTFTVTIATPGVVTLAGHKLLVGDSVYLKTTGALPTGLSQNTLYYVNEVPSSSTFKLATTRGGAAINTTGSQSGVHSLFFCPHGLGDGSTTFNIPDSRGRATIAPDNMTTTAGAAGRLATVNRVPGASGGEETHTLTTTEMPVHNHEIAVTYPTIADGRQIPLGQNGTTYFNNSGGANHINTAGGGGAHNNMQPYLVVTKIVRVL